MNGSSASQSRRKIVLAAGVVALLSLSVAWLSGLFAPREPVYAGHPISYWINLTNDPPVGLILASIYPQPATNYSDYPFPAVDSNAVPYLLQALKRRNGRWQKFYTKWEPKLPAWIQKLVPVPVSADTIHANAAFMLGTIDPVSIESIRALIEALKLDAGRFAGSAEIGALRQLGGPNDRGVRELVEIAATEGDRVLQICAIQALATARRGNLLVVSALGKLKDDTNKDVRDAAVSALNNYTAKPPEPKK